MALRVGGRESRVVPFDSQLMTSQYLPIVSECLSVTVFSYFDRSFRVVEDVMLGWTIGWLVHPSITRFYFVKLAIKMDAKQFRYL